MRIIQISTKNFRTLEDLTVDFRNFYTAICGKNDSGKTNVVRAIRKVVGDEDPYLVFVDEPDFSVDEDFTQWKPPNDQDSSVDISVKLEIDGKKDAGLHQFLADYLLLKSPPNSLAMTLGLKYVRGANRRQAIVNIGGTIYDANKADEILKKLQSSRSILFHNSTEPKLPGLYSRRYLGSLTDFSEEYQKDVEAIRRSISKGVKHITRTHQRQVEDLLGRLESKYKVSLSVPTYRFENLPYGIALGDTKVEVLLNEWGSGTQNRTLILMMLLKARQISESTASASKITPVIFIEEPESFLHPSAQAKFGRVIQDLAAEFGVQVIVTTHSPYMLSKSDPEANVLLERRTFHNQLRATEKVDTAGKNWMEPFGLALGVSKEEFTPWQKLFLSGSECVVLVEGDIDREYFELLRDETHQENRLSFIGDILPYDGKDNLKNSVLLRFVQNRYDLAVVTFDLDAAAEVIPYVERLGFEKGKTYFAVGKDVNGKRNIEGLVPEQILQAVYAANGSLVSEAMNEPGKARNSARQRLKRLILDEFKAKAKPLSSDFESFYRLAAQINKSAKKFTQ